MSAGTWARELADTYAKIAQESVDPQKSEANAAEASKYYGIAARMDAFAPSSNPNPAPDPFGIYETFGGDRYADRFAGLHTYKAVNDEWTADRGTEFAEQLEVRAAAVKRSRQLRSTFASVVPTRLPVEGRDQNPFASCQTDAELVELFSLATEEPPGDGEASATSVRRWRARIAAQASARRAELLAAGVVRGTPHIR